MANNKVGFEYYNIDTNRYQDIKIKRLKKDFGTSGIAVYDYILCEIYRVRGCFLVWDESTAFDVAEYFGLKENLVNEIVNYCCAAGLFDKALLVKYHILTNIDIQRQWVKLSMFVDLHLIPKKCLLIDESTIPFYKKNKRARLYERNLKLWKRISKEIFARDNYTCCYCGEKGGILEVDHIIPFSKGGTDNLENLITSCRKCNRQKKDMSVNEFKLWRERYGKA